MSETMVARVWRHAPTRGSKKLVLLALAMASGPDGVCAVSMRQLAAWVGEDERRCRRLLRELRAMGLIAQQAGAAGAATRYAVLAGLTAEAAQEVRARLAAATPAGAGGRP